KLTFFIYLWNPKTEGTTYVYESFSRPYLLKHETEIDRRILETRHRLTDNSILKATSYDQTRASETMWYVVPIPRKRKSKPTQDSNGAVTKQTSTLALNNYLTPILEENLSKQRLQTRSCPSEEGNIPSPMRSPPTKLQEPTLLEQGLLENLKQPPLWTKSSPAQMKVSPTFIDEVTSQFKENPELITQVEMAWKIFFNYMQADGPIDNADLYAHWLYLCLWCKDDQKFRKLVVCALATDIIKDQLDRSTEQ
ncbi:hypothetical protein MKW92_006880, partial [Papaver armeniacum]